jgi:hypothetical protein
VLCREIIFPVILVWCLDTSASYRNNLYRTRTQNSFRGCDLCSCNLLTEATWFLPPFFYRHYVQNYTSHLQRDPNLEQTFVAVAFVHLIHSQKTTGFCPGIVLLSCLVSNLHKPSSQGQHFGASDLVPLTSSSKQTTLVWCRPSFILRFRATGKYRYSNPGHWFWVLVFSGCKK